MFLTLSMIFAFATLTDCASSPTGRKQLKLIDSGQMSQLGIQSFDELKKQQPISTDPKQNQLVQCVTNALLKAMGKDPSQWEIRVFKDDTPNAFALPGNKVGVHTGMITLVQNPDQLAAVIGHEIGHVLANHGNERMSQALVAQAGMTAAALALGQDSQKDQLIIAALGVGTQFGVLLPYQRTQESEADTLGVEYMAKAGFDPMQSVQLWKLMAAKTGKGPAEFLSTHPSNSSRINALGKLAPKYVPVYEAVKNKPQCHL